MSVFSYPNRGKWGNNKWRGNCSGHMMVDLFTHLKPKLFVDCMMGSGTTIEVAEEMGIPAVGLDLHSGFNALRDDILERVGQPADLVFSHPPYAGMIKYSGQVWGDEAFPDDLSHCLDDEDFNQKMQMVLMNQRNATLPGKYYGMLIGDWRRNGVYSCYAAEAMARMPKDELASVLIKTQHNMMSNSKDYGKMEMPFITHEYLVLWKRKAITTLQVLKSIASSHQARLTGTWRAIVHQAIVELGGKTDLASLYAKIGQGHEDRLEANANWQAKVRQTLQLNQDFSSDERGVWKLAA